MWANIAPTRSNQTEEAREADQTVGAGHPPIRRNRRQSIEAGAEAKAKAEEPAVELPVKAVSDKVIEVGEVVEEVEEPVVESPVKAVLDKVVEEVKEPVIESPVEAVPDEVIEETEETREVRAGEARKNTRN